MMEELSSFAISIAANIVCALFPKNKVEKEIRSAFEEAVEDWSPNEDIRRYQEKDLHQLMLQYIAHPNLNIADLKKEMKDFIGYFQLRIAAHSAAANYLSEIKNKEYHSIIYKQLHVINTKLDHVTEILENNNVRNEELHAEAIIEINTVIEYSIIDKIKTIFNGVINLFENSFVTQELTENKKVVLRLDSGSRKIELEDGDVFQPKYQDRDYNWDLEKDYCWSKMSSLDISEIISESYLTSFQVLTLEFSSSIEQIKNILNQNTINEQLSIDEKKQINYIIQNLRALESVYDDHKWIFVPVDLKFKNLIWEKRKIYQENEERFNEYNIIYCDEEYSQTLETIFVPKDMESNLLDVWIINPDFYFKLSEYLENLIASIVQWWNLCNKNRKIMQ